MKPLQGKTVSQRRYEINTIVLALSMALVAFVLSGFFPIAGVLGILYMWWVVRVVEKTLVLNQKLRVSISPRWSFFTVYLLPLAWIFLKIIEHDEKENPTHYE